MLEATEDAARGLEIGRAEQLTPDARRLLEAAAAYLRDAVGGACAAAAT